MNRVVRINAGGRPFHTYLSTLLRFPDTAFAQLFRSLPPRAPAVEAAAEDIFVDVSPDVFDRVLRFLRTGAMQLPTHDESLRAAVVHHLRAWGLLQHAFHEASAEEDAAATTDLQREEVVQLPDVCVVQLCDHLQHDQGVKRHAMTITYGADGFQLRHLTQAIRRDLHQQLSSTFWQCYQTNERAAFFTTTKVANGAADLLTTSITQQVITHTEAIGYHLVSSYVTLSPDVVHTSVRMLIHNFVFRRVRLPVPEAADVASLAPDSQAGEEDVIETFSNFQPRPVGPQKLSWQGSASSPPESERARDIWEQRR